MLRPTALVKRIVDSSTKNALSFSSARTIKRPASSHSATAIQNDLRAVIQRTPRRWPRCSKERARVTQNLRRKKHSNYNGFFPIPFNFVAHLFAGIAQLVEQLICNQQVVGSNPTAGSIVNPDHAPRASASP